MSVSIYGGFESIISKLLSVSLSNKLDSINSIFTLFKFAFFLATSSASWLISVAVTVEFWQ